MSEINSHNNRAFVRTEHLPQMAPPASTTGAVGWARENLFSSPLNTALTLGSIYFLYLIIPPFFDWAFVTSAWFGSSN